MHTTRVVLAAIGIGALLWGGWLLVTTQRWDQWLNVVLWLAAAVILHDFVLVPALSFIRRHRRHGEAAERGEAARPGEAAPEPTD